MTIVKELNNLSEKMTGKNAKAYTDAQAVKFIADNYEDGGPSITPVIITGLREYIGNVYDALDNGVEYLEQNITDDSTTRTSIENALNAFTQNNATPVFMEFAGSLIPACSLNLIDTTQSTYKGVYFNLTNGYYDGTKGILETFYLLIALTQTGFTITSLIKTTELVAQS